MNIKINLSIHGILLYFVLCSSMTGCDEESVEIIFVNNTKDDIYMCSDINLNESFLTKYTYKQLKERFKFKIIKAYNYTVFERYESSFGEKIPFVVIKTSEMDKNVIDDNFSSDVQNIKYKHFVITWDELEKNGYIIDYKE